VYLSRVFLDTTRMETIRALSSPQIIHGAVEAAVETDDRGSEQGQRRLLWRIDYLTDKCSLLLLSEAPPNLSLLVHQFGFPGVHEGETKSYLPLLDRLREGQRWRFRLRANPVRSSFKEKDEETGRGKVFAHVTPEQQKQWLIRKSATCGFSLEPDEFDVIHSEWKKFSKNQTGGRHQVTLRTVTFEGILTVVDPVLFRQTLIKGIGRAKAYGCGLMTIMPMGR